VLPLRSRLCRRLSWFRSGTCVSLGQPDNFSSTSLGKRPSPAGTEASNGWLLMSTCFSLLSFAKSSGRTCRPRHLPSRLARDSVICSVFRFTSPAKLRGSASNVPPERRQFQVVLQHQLLQACQGSDRGRQAGLGVIADLEYLRMGGRGPVDLPGRAALRLAGAAHRRTA